MTTSPRSSTGPSTEEAAGSDGDNTESTPASFDAALSADPGFIIWRSVIPPHLVQGALRVLNLEIARSGLSADEIARCARSTFFPHLRWEPDILSLRDPIDRLLGRRADEEWADSQLLLRFPDEAEDWPLTPHVDEPPPWAGGRPYRAVVGVTLSSSMITDGCLTVWPGSHTGRAGAPLPLELEAGDAVVMHPQLQHSGTLNRGGNIRYVVYFRLLAGIRPAAEARAAGHGAFG